MQSDPPKTPITQQANCKAKSTPNGIQRRAGLLYGMLKTPTHSQTPTSRLAKIINPFENGLNERLHLPLIASPSLFVRPSTPVLSQSTFEWTIDEMSSLNPTSFEAHETQFISTTDPDVEAKAQATINLFFKDNNIVPSPKDCPLRKQKIILPKSTRDGICQTELSLPPNLPKEMEDLLKPYFTQTMDQQQSPFKDCDRSFYEARDASLIQKLFGEPMNITNNSIYEENADSDGLSPLPLTPEMNCTRINSNGLETSYQTPSRTSRNEKSFGSLSPIMITPTKSLPSSAQSNSSIYRSTPEHTTSNSVNMLEESQDNCLDDNQIETNVVGLYDFNKYCTMSSLTDEEKIFSYVRTPSRRKDRYLSPKNLSHSFSCLNEMDCDDGDVRKAVSANIATDGDSGFNDEDSKNKTGDSSKLLPKSCIQYVNEIMDVDCQSPRGK